MTRVLVQWLDRPESVWLDLHLKLCDAVPGAIVRHGEVTRTLHGSPCSYVTELEFASADALSAAAAALQLVAEDAGQSGIEHAVYVIELALRQTPERIDG